MVGVLSNRFGAMQSILKHIFLMLALVVSFPHRGTAETHIDFGCLGNNTATCFVLIEGQIEKGLTDRFLQFLEDEGVEGSRLILNSPGGSLGEALKLGRVVRELEWRTMIGGRGDVTRDAEGRITLWIWDDYPSDGICESACTYVFMGGVNRSMGKGGRLGLHRFKAVGQQITGDAAQAISGQLISYILEMGVDARVFVLASGEDSGSMYHVSEADALEYDLVTPSGFQPFFLEPYREGIIAATKRADSSVEYDLVDQVTAYCSQNSPMLVYYATQHGLTDESRAEFTAEIDGQAFELPSSAVSVQTTDAGAYISVRLDAPVARMMVAARDIWTHFGFAMVSGGAFETRLTPSQMDRDMLRAAFRFCIN